MADIVERFKKALDAAGIGYRRQGVSLAVEYCPECGDRRYIVLFRMIGVSGHEPLFGGCKTGVCGKGYSSITYLMKLGMSKEDALGVHGYSSDVDFTKVMNDDIDISCAPKEEKKKVFIENDVSGFFRVGWNSECPTSKYAIKRGYVPEFNDIIKVDIQLGAVVFIVRGDDGGVIGFQRRFLNVPKDEDKTKSSSGFIKSQNLLKFFRKGADILVCEGPFTALSAWHYGYYGICTFGSGISLEQLSQIKMVAEAENVNVAVAEEDDEAGRKYFRSINSYFYNEKLKVYAIYPEAGNDLNDSWQKGKSLIIDTERDENPGIPSVDFI